MEALQWTDFIGRIRRGFGIAEKCQSLSPPIQKFKVRLASKDPKPALPDWPKGRIYAIYSDEQWKDVVPKILNKERELIGEWISLLYICVLFVVCCQA